MNERRITVNGVELFVRLLGKPNDKPVLLLHGFPENSDQWQSLSQHLVARGYFVVMPDQRGYFRSSKPPHVKDYAIDTLAQDAVELMTHLGYEKFYLVGHDWGGFVAWQVVDRYPHHLIKAVTMNSALLRIYERMLLSFRPQQLIKSWYVFLFQISAIAEPLFLRGLGHLFFKGFSGKPSITPETYDAYHKAWTTDNAIHTMMMWYRHATRHALLSFWGDLLRLKNPYRKFPLPTEKFKTPMLVLWGEQDLALSKSLATQSIALCEQGQVMFFPNSSHWITHDLPDEVNHHVETFFA